MDDKLIEMFMNLDVPIVLMPTNGKKKKSILQKTIEDSMAREDNKKSFGGSQIVPYVS